MDFVMPTYTAPDFTRPEFLSAPDAAFETVEKDGVAPEDFHSTSMYPEYVKLEGRWRLAEESRMDSCISPDNPSASGCGWDDAACAKPLPRSAGSAHG